MEGEFFIFVVNAVDKALPAGRGEGRGNDRWHLVFRDWLTINGVLTEEVAVSYVRAAAEVDCLLRKQEIFEC